jgi:hypothetical protein
MGSFAITANWQHRSKPASWFAIVPETAANVVPMKQRLADVTNS